MPDALVEVDGHIMTVTMNRPQRYNAMTLQMFARMADAWQQASEDDDIRVHRSSPAPRATSAPGMDLARWRATSAGPTTSTSSAG